LWVDPHLLRHQESVRVLPELADELAGSIELKQSRATMRERSRTPERHRRMACARVNEHVAFRIRRDARRLAEMDVRWPLQRISRVERDLRHRELSGQPPGRCSHTQSQSNSQRLLSVCHDDL